MQLQDLQLVSLSKQLLYAARTQLWGMILSEYVGLQRALRYALLVHFLWYRRNQPENQLMLLLGGTGS